MLNVCAFQESHTKTICQCSLKARLKRCVFGSLLLTRMSGSAPMFSGIEFHAAGPADVKIPTVITGHRHKIFVDFLRKLLYHVLPAEGVELGPETAQILRN